MSSSSRWDQLSLPRMADLKQHERRRFIDLHRLRELVVNKVRKNDSGQLLQEESFWVAAAPRLSHPLSSDWIARQGMPRAKRSASAERSAAELAAGSLGELLEGPTDDAVCERLRVVAGHVVPGKNGMRVLDISMVKSGGGQGVIFPPAAQVPRLLAELVEDCATTDLPPSAKSVCLLAVFLNIHPLEDGNGRCGRALFSWLNARADSGWDLYIPLRKIIEISQGGFEIRVREAELYGNWLPLIDYFISIYQWIHDRILEIKDFAPSRGSVVEPVLRTDFNLRDGMMARALHRYRNLGRASPFLCNGEAGVALALHQAALSTGCEKLEQQSKDAIRNSVELLDSFPLSSGLYAGVTGVGFAVCVMGADDELRILDDLDCVLGEGLLSGRNLKFDIVNGVAGVIIYAIERKWRGGASDVLVDGLNAALRTILLGDEGEYLPRIEDLGMAHGLAGVLAACATGIECGLLDAALLGPVGQAYDDLWCSVGQYDSTFCVPSKKTSVERSRIAWCYGSLGASVSFLQSSTLVPRNRNRALELVRWTLNQLRANQHGIVDASVCHGWSGGALILDYLSRHPALGSRELSNQLFSETKRMLGETDRMGNQSDGRFPFARGEMLVESPGLLEGALGVACAVQAVAERQTPAWATMLGLTRPWDMERKPQMPRSY